MKKFNINQFCPCDEGKEYYATQPDFETAWNNCKRGDWMLWMAKKLNVDDKTLTLAKAHCANTVRHLMKDQRSIDAVDAAIKYGNGEISRAELDKFAASAKDASSAASASAAASFSSAASASAAAYAAADAASFTDYVAAFYAAVANSYATSVVAAAAADVASAAFVSAASYAAAKEENQKQTADICRKYLTKEVFNKINNN